MFNITNNSSTINSSWLATLRTITGFILVIALALILAGCGVSKEADDDAANAQRFSVAVPFSLAEHIVSVRFEVTDENGDSQVAEVPLVRQGLPTALDPSLAGHSFADWFVVLEPGSYDILATPLKSDNQPSDICGPAAGTVTVFNGVTTEIVLMSNCDAHSGGLDVALVFNHSPHIKKLVISPNKFLCIGKQVVLAAAATDADGDPLEYDWQVTDTPAAADSSDYRLLPDDASPWAAEFSANLPGTYQLTLTVGDGHGSSSLGFPIYLSDCDAPDGASVHGTKWRDENGDAERDPGEPGLPGVTIYSDSNGNAAFDPGEPSALSMEDDPDTDFDEAGRYWLKNLPAGQHSIRELVPDGYRQTFPGTSGSPVNGIEQNTGTSVLPAAINVSLAAGESFDTRVQISFSFLCIRSFDIDVIAADAPAGMLQNLSGVLENGCGGDVSEFDIRLTGDGSSQSFELRFVDAEFGGVLGIIPVRITPPGEAAHSVLLESGGVVEGLDFGNQPRAERASVHGRKWLDRNRNARLDDGEPGLPGVVIYSDLNDNGAFDEDEPSAVSMDDDPITDFDEGGLYWLEGLAPGGHTIREVVPDGFRQTFPSLQPVVGDGDGSAFETTPDALNLVIAAGASLDTQVALTIGPFCIRPFEIILVAAAAPTGTFQNLTGQLTNGCGGSTSSFDIRLMHAGGVVNFDIDFVDAEFGGVIASLPVQISDSGAGSHRVRLVAGQAVDGLNFGNAMIDNP